jgi:hypothetical protein
MSHLNEPMLPADERPEDAPMRVIIVPPYTDHEPCGGPGCGKSATGKWAEPVYLIEVRGISPTWGGLETAITRLAMCNRCYTLLGDLATDAYMAEEERAIELLKAEEE